jgi:magnesium-transporting ATPase (P-type)
MEENSFDPEPPNAMDVEEVEPDEVLLSEKGLKFLRQTRPWVRFMSIIVYISVVFMALGGLTIFLAGLTGNFFGNNSMVFASFPGGTYIAGLVYIILAVLYIVPGVFLSRYASAIKSLETSPSPELLESALKYQKSFWRYVGVFTVVCLVVAASAFAFGFALALFNFLNR